MYLSMHTVTKIIFFSCWCESSYKNYYRPKRRKPMVLLLFAIRNFISSFYFRFSLSNIAMFLKIRLFKIIAEVGRFTRSHLLQAWCQCSSVGMWDILGGIETWYLSSLECNNVNVKVTNVDHKVSYKINFLFFVSCFHVLVILPQSKRAMTDNIAVPLDFPSYRTVSWINLLPF